VMADEYYVTSPVVHEFMTHVLQACVVESSAPLCIERIRPRFEALLATPGWLPGEFACASRPARWAGASPPTCYIGGATILSRSRPGDSTRIDHAGP